MRSPISRHADHFVWTSAIKRIFLPPIPVLAREMSLPIRTPSWCRKAQAGDLQAFEVLVERHGKRVYRTLVGLLGSPEEARDAMQDTFLKAFQHLAGFQGRSKFSTWLLTIASNAGLQRLRRKKTDGEP